MTCFFGRVLGLCGERAKWIVVDHDGRCTHSLTPSAICPMLRKRSFRGAAAFYRMLPCPASAPTPNDSHNSAPSKYRVDRTERVGSHGDRRGRGAPAVAATDPAKYTMLFITRVSLRPRHIHEMRRDPVVVMVRLRALSLPPPFLWTPTPARLAPSCSRPLLRSLDGRWTLKEISICIQHPNDQRNGGNGAAS